MTVIRNVYRRVKNSSIRTKVILMFFLAITLLFFKVNAVSTLLLFTAMFLVCFYLLYRSVIAPLGNISSWALQLAGGEMEARIPITSIGSCYEIQQLVDAFNYMAASVQEHNVSLQTLNNELAGKNFELTEQRDELEQQKQKLLILNKDLEESLQALDDSQGLIYALAVAVEAKDPYTRGHSERVAEYSTKLAGAIGLPLQQLELIQGAALLHDIGKIGVSGNILRKPGALTAIEFQQVKKHPAIGERICTSLKFAREMLPIIRHHHEHHNGMGYPDGLKGEKIPLMARIVAVADAFDAMTSDRPYRSGMSTEEALKIMEDGAGSQWDFGLVAVFIRLIRKELRNKRGQFVDEEEHIINEN